MTREVYPMEDLRPTMVNTAQLPYDLELVIRENMRRSGKPWSSPFSHLFRAERPF